MMTYAQCTIEGPNQLKVGEESVYHVPTEYAQCEDCHQWKAIGALGIQRDNRKHKVTVYPKGAGKVALGVMLLTPNGIEQCSKNITIVRDNMASQGSYAVDTPKKVDCDITISDFKEVKYQDNTVAFFPNSKDDSYMYTWEANYTQGGEPKVSNEKVPVFDNNTNNMIEKVTLNITSKKCLKKYSKKYTPSFWQYFNSK